MEKVLKTFSLIVIIIFGLSLFGWMVFHISKGDKKFGALTEPIRFMVTFPDLFTQSVEEVKALPKTFLKTPEDFKSINLLDSDFTVLSTYSESNDDRSIVLMNLRNDSVQYKWTVSNPFKEHDRIMNPLLFPGKSLVYAFECRSGLTRIDSVGEVIWKQDSIKVHHSLNLSKDGNIWICSFEPVYYATGTYKLNGRSVYYIDNYITKLDADTGRILYHKSMTDILNENKLSSYILKSNRPKDPFHINDVQPALKTTEYYEVDDLFISSRNLSVVLHYRPSTNKIIKIIEGGFTSQHDVDFHTDNSLVFFNNNFYTVWTTDSEQAPKESSRLKNAGDFYSNIVHYDFENDKISYIGDSVFRQNEIFTNTEGLVEFVDPSTYFVEEQNTGVIWIIRDEQVIYKNVLPSQHEGHHHLPNWIRTIN